MLLFLYLSSSYLCCTVKVIWHLFHWFSAFLTILFLLLYLHSIYLFCLEKKTEIVCKCEDKLFGVRFPFICSKMFHIKFHCCTGTFYFCFNRIYRGGCWKIIYLLNILHTTSMSDVNVQRFSGVLLNKIYWWLLSWIVFSF